MRLFLYTATFLAVTHEVFGVSECYNNMEATTTANCTAQNNGTCFTRMVYINESSQSTNVTRGCAAIDACKNNCAVQTVGAESTRTCEDCCYKTKCNMKKNLFDGGISSSSHITISILTVLGLALVARLFHS
eukprot:TCONS_00067458-protein